MSCFSVILNNSKELLHELTYFCGSFYHSNHAHCVTDSFLFTFFYNCINSFLFISWISKSKVYLYWIFNGPGRNVILLDLFDFWLLKITWVVFWLQRSFKGETLDLLFGDPGSRQPRECTSETGQKSHIHMWPYYHSLRTPVSESPSSEIEPKRGLSGWVKNITSRSSVGGNTETVTLFFLVAF